MKKVIRALAATAFFVLLLVAIYFVHVRYFTVDVVFYSAIADGALAATITSTGTFCFRYFRELGSFEKFQLFLIWLLMGYALAISVPTVIDRSLSFYILEKLQQRGGGIQLARFDEVFVDEYMIEHQLLRIRLTEQLASGTVQVHNGCVRLTPWGEQLAYWSRTFRTHLLPHRRLVMGEYTDALTDPFRAGAPSPGYEC